MNVSPGKAVRSTYKYTWWAIAAALWLNWLRLLFKGRNNALKAHKARKA